MIAPHGIDEIRSVYGDIRIARVNGNWEVVSPQRWESNNCKVVRDLPGVGPRALYIHRLIEDPLRAALAASQLACPDYLIRTIGCFNPRTKRANATEISLHSWAVAVDINADTNPMRAPLTCDMPAAFIDAFISNGWTWGGTFPTPDPMHMQYASGY